ncbi:hypothetical protein DFH09DRAFT_1344123 [Mycena vulgaris]|nr:hypothetical protein DFH09DRAFT_1344123 [Mycena vulgaris]
MSLVPGDEQVTQEDSGAPTWPPYPETLHDRPEARHPHLPLGACQRPPRSPLSMPRSVNTTLLALLTGDHPQSHTQRAAARARGLAASFTPCESVDRRPASSWGHGVGQRATVRFLPHLTLTTLAAVLSLNALRAPSGAHRLRSPRRNALRTPQRARGGRLRTQVPFGFSRTQDASATLHTRRRRVALPLQFLSHFWASRGQHVAVPSVAFSVYSMSEPPASPTTRPSRSPRVGVA